MRIFCDEVDSPAEGGPHMVFVSTDEGVRYSDGSLLETTASQADKVTMMIMINWDGLDEDFEYFSQ